MIPGKTLPPPLKERSWYEEGAITRNTRERAAKLIKQPRRKSRKETPFSFCKRKIVV